MTNALKPLQLQRFRKDNSNAFALIRNNRITPPQITLLLKVRRKAFNYMEIYRRGHESIRGSDSPRSPQLREIRRCSGPRGSLRNRLERALRTVAQGRRGVSADHSPRHISPPAPSPSRPPKYLRKEVSELSETDPSGARKWLPKFHSRPTSRTI